MNKPLDPSHIMQTASAFWASKTLLSAIELRLFTVLGDGAMTAEQLGQKLGLHPRGTYDFFDALVALKFLERDGDGPAGRYRNTPETALFLDKNKPSYIGGLPEMLNSRLYPDWIHLTEGLRTGKPQTEVARSGKPVFDAMYADEKRLVEFLEAMSSVQMQNFALLAEKFDFAGYETLSDVGGALALLSCTVARRHARLRCNSFDLPVVGPHARQRIEAAGLSDRVTVVSGDFFADPLPKADVVTMGNILHDWNLEKKRILVKKAYDALPAGGAFIVIENIIDDARRENAFGLLMSLNMLVETGDGYDYTFAHFQSFCGEAGFRRFEILPLAGPASAAIAYK